MTQIALVLLCARLGASPPPAERLSFVQVDRDARTLLHLLEASHPDPYSPMGGKVAFKLRANQLLAELPKEGLTRREFEDRLRTFLAGLRDGHTLLLGPAAGTATIETLLPFRFGVGPTGLYLLASDAAALDGKIGSELVGLQGVPTEKLLGRVAQIRGVENDFNGLAQLRRTLATLQGVESLVNGPAADHLRLDLKPPGVARVTVEVPLPRAGSDKDVLKWRTPPPRWDKLARSDDPFSFQVFEEESAAWFRISSIMGREAFEFAKRYGWGDVKGMLEAFYKRSGKPMPADLDAALAGVPSFLEVGDKLIDEMKKRKLRTLVVDLQGNGGGVTPMVYPFLYELFGDAFFEQAGQARFVTVWSQLYLDKLHLTLEQARQKSGDARREVGDYVTETGMPATAKERRLAQLKEYREKGMSFSEKLDRLDGQPVFRPASVVVLCDADTFSAAFHFLFHLKQLGAKVVGIPPGQAPNAFMEMTEFTLPESGLRGSISNSAQMLVPDQPQLGVLAPDFPLTDETLRRFGWDQASELRWALELIRQHKL
jgi:hypothetical protein